MVRKVTFVVRAAPGLGALLSFSQATRKRRSGLGERLEREVTQSLSAAARTLDPILELVRWLCRRGLARFSGYVDVNGLAVETKVSLDLRLAVAAALGQGSRVDARAYADLYALRSLVRSLRETELLTLDNILLGRHVDTPRALLRTVDEACRETALGDESLVPKAFQRVAPAPPEPVDTDAPRDDNASVVRSQAPTVAPPKRSKATRPTSTDSTPTTGSFGDLPDDATSPPAAPPETLSTRGLTIEAEAALELARLTAWPCSPRTLARARRALLIRLHPDRAGEGSEVQFRRALKGFEDLARVLADSPSQPSIDPVVRPTLVTTAAAGFGQWPPPAEASPPAEDSDGRPFRQSFRRSSKA